MNCRLFLVALTVAIGSGCSEQRSHAVNDQGAAKSGTNGEPDYRQMLERSRSRQQSRDSLQAMQDALQRFQRDMGRLPTNIVELVVRNYVPIIPELPPGKQFAYDANAGTLFIANVAKPDTLTPALPPAPELTNRPTLSPLPRP